MVRTVLLAMAALVMSTAPGAALEVRTGDLVTVGPGEVIADDLFVAGSEITIAGQVEGDVFAGGQTIKITGPVDGSVMAAGREVAISGPVRGSARAVGQSVVVAGSVGRNVAAAGNSVALEKEGTVGRDFHAAGATIRVDGPVQGRVGLAGQSATIGHRVGGDVYFEGERLSLTPSTEIGGNLVHRSRKKVSVPAGAQIHGTTQALPPREPRPRRGWSPWDFAFALAVFVFGVVGMALFPRLFTAAANAMHNRGWWNLLLGVIALAIVPFAAVVVCLTLVGLPVGLFVLFQWGVGILAAGVPVGTFVGRLLLGVRRPVSPYLALFIGLLALTLVGLVPVLGGLTKFLTVLFGLGVYARAAKGLLVEMRLRPA